MRGGVVAVTLPAVDEFDGSEDERSVLSALASGRVLSRGALEDETGLSRAHVLAALETLVARGAVVRSGRGRATRYARP